jgi:hypothetical protein
LGKQARSEGESCSFSPLGIFFSFLLNAALIKGVNPQHKEKSACVLSIMPFINTVFLSEFLAAVPHATFSLICPALV